MSNHQRNISGLRPVRATDCDQKPVIVTARIDPDDKDWLKSLPEGTSYHVRQAIRAYKSNSTNVG
jgi:hypothetical protein